MAAVLISFSQNVILFLYVFLPLSSLIRVTSSEKVGIMLYAMLCEEATQRL